MRSARSSRRRVAGEVSATRFARRASAQHHRKRIARRRSITRACGGRAKSHAAHIAAQTPGARHFTQRASRSHASPARDALLARARNGDLRSCLPARLLRIKLLPSRLQTLDRRHTKRISRYTKGTEEQRTHINQKIIYVPFVLL